MKSLAIVIISLGILLLLASLVYQHAQGTSLVQSQISKVKIYEVKPGAVSGGNYRLTGFPSRETNLSIGERYRFLGPASPFSSENGCCCVYLPCVRR